MTKTVYCIGVSTLIRVSDVRPRPEEPLRLPVLDHCLHAVSLMTRPARAEVVITAVPGEFIAKYVLVQIV